MLFCCKNYPQNSTIISFVRGVISVPSFQKYYNNYFFNSGSLKAPGIGVVVGDLGAVSAGTVDVTLVAVSVVGGIGGSVFCALFDSGLTQQVHGIMLN